MVTVRPKKAVVSQSQEASNQRICTPPEQRQAEPTIVVPSVHGPARPQGNCAQR